MIRFTNYPPPRLDARANDMKINFYERYQPARQLEYLEDALFNGFLSTDGRYTELLKEHFRKVSGIHNTMFTPSATAALELAVQLLDLQPGDEVIIPSYTFPSAASAVIKYGGSPVFCDIDTATKNISLDDAASRITSRTKAVIPTHYAGISCDMTELMKLADAFQITVIEDAAQAAHSCYNDQALGTIGDFGAYSFHHTKNFSCGEGGAFLCKDPGFLARAEIIRDNGTNRAQFRRSEVSSYSWQCEGSNFMMSEACAALLYSQLLDYETVTAKRKSAADQYGTILGESREWLDGKIALMKVPAWASPNYHIYYINCGSHEIRESLRTGMLADGIDVRTHFVPLHLSDFGKALGYLPADLPNSTTACDTLLRLPIHTEMTWTDCEIAAESLIRQVRKLK